MHDTTTVITNKCRKKVYCVNVLMGYNQLRSINPFKMSKALMPQYVVLQIPQYVVSSDLLMPIVSGIVFLIICLTHYFNKEHRILLPLTFDTIRS